MLLEIVSYNGHALNDASFAAWFPRGQPLGPSAQPNYAPRSETWQKLSNKNIDAVTLSFHIECKGTIHTQLETLKSWFPINDFTPRALIVKDTADSNRQWYVMGYATQPVTPVPEGAGEYIITLALDEPLWRTVTVDSTLWVISSSGDTEALTLLGNEVAKPTLTINIQGGKLFGYAYRLWKPWYNPLDIENREPLEITGGGLNTNNLIADTSKSNQINQGGGINASTLSIPIDTPVGGGLPTTGGMCYVDTEQILYTSISGGTMTVAAGGRGYGGTTAATHADNAVIKMSQLMANLQDLRVIWNKAEIDSWNTGAGTATKIWINPKFKARIELTLDGAITDVEATPFTVTVKETAANKAALKRLPARFIFMIDTEVFFGDTVRASAYTFVARARAQKGSSAAAHTDGATIRWIEHDPYIVWGDSQATAQVTNNRKKPMLNLSTSTNVSWDWDEFASEDGLRTAGWVDSIEKQLGTESYMYTDTEGALVDPATVIGIAAKAWQLNALNKAENFSHIWQVYHPAGFTTVTASGKKRRISTDWPAMMAFRKSADGQVWSNVFNEATPASPGSFGALSAHSGVAFGAGTWRYARFQGRGSVLGTTGNEIDMEFSDITLVITSANVLQSAFSASVESAYYLNPRISVVETGHAITLKGPCKTGDVIVVDCDAETITQNGKDANVEISFNTERVGWLDLPSPQQSACTLKYVEVGVADVEITVARENRNSL